MDKEKILGLVEECIEKAANDFLAEKPVDHQSLYALLESVRILNHAAKLQNQENV